VILENFAHVLQQVRAKTPLKHVVVTSLGEMLGLKGLVVNLVVRKLKKMVPAYELPGSLKFKEVLKDGKGRKLTTPALAHGDIAFLQYTGGTTGVSKGAILTHRNVIAALLQYRAWLGPAISDKERTIIITALPLYHIFSLTVNCLVMMVVGGENILITNPKDIPGFVKELGRHKYTMISGVNTLFNALLNHPDFAKLDFSHLKLAVGGGMAVQRAVAERWKQTTGTTLIEGYGLTETAPSATANPLDLKEFSGSIGVPMSSTEVLLRDDNGASVPLGQPGEICIRGPQVMAGYWKRPEETAQVMKGGFLHTGDVGIMDEKGFIRIVDRKKDMILVSGFNVYPNEIEQIVAMHPGVLECAVIGVDDEHSGEVPKAFVVKKDPQLTEQDVLEHCRKELTGYKRPKYVEFRTELPKTNVGKILRRALREEKKAA
jgi:long-chain acyl-CoA synthetase